MQKVGERIMSKELNDKCVEYKVTGTAKEFLENIERVYDEIAEAEREDNEPAMGMVEWINENVEYVNLEIKGFSEEQMFFFGMGILASEIMDRLEFNK